MSQILNTFRSAIIESEKTRYRLSKETGISESQLCEFVHGRRGMATANLELLAVALGLEIIIRPAKKKTRRGTKNQKKKSTTRKGR